MSTKVKKTPIFDLLNSPDRQTSGSGKEQFELLGNYRAGINEETGENVSSFSALRLSSKENCRVAFPSDNILVKIDDHAKVEDDQVLINLDFDLNKRKGTYWVNAVLPF